MKIFIDYPLGTYNKIKKYFKYPKGFFYFGKTVNVPLVFWIPWNIISISDVMWKDKFGSPRFEESPYLLINLFGYSFGYIWKFNNEDEYWEQALWYLYYCDSNLEKAKKSWPWEDMKGNSTWKNEFLI